MCLADWMQVALSSRSTENGVQRAGAEGSAIGEGRYFRRNSEAWRSNDSFGHRNRATTMMSPERRAKEMCWWMRLMRESLGDMVEDAYETNDELEASSAGAAFRWSSVCLSVIDIPPASRTQEQIDDMIKEIPSERVPARTVEQTEDM